MKTCTKCKTEKSLSSFYVDKHAPDKHSYVCKNCEAAYHRQYRANHLDREKEVQLLFNHGLTMQQWNELFVKQNGLCAICGNWLRLPENGLGKGNGLVHTDHDHRTGKIRGLLCGKCNMGIGLFKDSVDILRSASEYLRK
jgi:hypothetical protein